MTTAAFARLTGFYTAAEHIDCAKEIAESMFLTIPPHFEPQVVAIMRHLDEVQMRTRSCSDAETLPAVA